MSLPFEMIVHTHTHRYPEMEAQDYAKLAYQSEFGPAHMLSADPAVVLQVLSQEWHDAPDALTPTVPENIGNGLCRFPLSPRTWSDEGVQLLNRLFRLTAESCNGTSEGLESKLMLLESLPIPDIKEWIIHYRQSGCPAPRHSAAYNAAYHPHYRLLRSEYAHYFPLLLRIQSLVNAEHPVLIAIDGRCGSGKTSLAKLLASLFPCRLFHTDDFYLPMNRRVENWQSIPAGNMDLSRLREEVLLPARANEEIFYRPFSCCTQQLLDSVPMPPALLNIVEGSYSLHPELEQLYDLKIFLTTSKEEQERRLRVREGDYFSAFQSLWIPLEEQYHHACGLPADTLELDTTTFF